MLHAKTATSVVFHSYLPVVIKYRKEIPRRNAREAKTMFAKKTRSPENRAQSLFPSIIVQKHMPNIMIDQLDARSVLDQHCGGKALAVKMALPQLYARYASKTHLLLEQQSMMQAYLYHRHEGKTSKIQCVACR